MYVVSRAAFSVILAALALLVIARPSVAEGCEVSAGDERGGMASQFEIQGQCLTHEPDEESRDDDASHEAVAVSDADEVETEPEPVWALEPVWGVHPETGEVCVDLVESLWVTVNDQVGLGWEARMLLMLHDVRLVGVEFRWCGQGAGVPVVDPSPLVHAFVRTVALPQVRLWVAPGYGLTGVPAFLEVSGQEGFEVGSQVAGFGSLRVWLAPVGVQVDWGDGTVVHVDDGRLGAPFDGDPAEQIVHEYLWPDDQIVVSVTVGWRAVWQVGGFSGVVEGLEVSGRMDLPVETRRAVRVAPDQGG